MNRKLVLWMMVFSGCIASMHANRAQVEKWAVFEWQQEADVDGNPFVDVQLSAVFESEGGESTRVSGFYDGEGRYMVRFMPSVVGEWRFVTSSNLPALDALEGTFTCVEPTGENRGPVSVADTYHFRYADGTPYFAFGTTAYAWQHQPEALMRTTLETLERYRFNKVRMCIFPKRFGDFINNEPEHYPYKGTAPDQWDKTRFNPAFFHHLEQAILDLQAIGVEADLILFHPYDEGHWGFDHMSDTEDDLYLKYVLARLSAYRNVWWAVANEWDLMGDKSAEDWERYLHIIDTHDPYRHLVSIHNAGKLYDHNDPVITHVSLQRHDPKAIPGWHADYGKPVILDEMSYEGDMGYNYGDLTGQQMTERFWLCVTRGGYGSHGEMYHHPENVLFWSKGGPIHGTSPERIRFLRELMEESLSGGLMPYPTEPWWNRKNCGSLGESVFFFYYEDYQPAFRPVTLPAGKAYTIDVIDTWNMTVERLEGTFSGYVEVPLPGKPYMALRVIEVDSNP